MKGLQIKNNKVPSRDLTQLQLERVHFQPRSIIYSTFRVRSVQQKHLHCKLKARLKGTSANCMHYLHILNNPCQWTGDCLWFPWTHFDMEPGNIYIFSSSFKARHDPSKPMLHWLWHAVFNVSPCRKCSVNNLPPQYFNLSFSHSCHFDAVHMSASYSVMMFSWLVSRPDRLRFPHASALSRLIANLSRQLHGVQTHVMGPPQERGIASRWKKVW